MNTFIINDTEDKTSMAIVYTPMFMVKEDIENIIAEVRQNNDWDYHDIENALSNKRCVVEWIDKTNTIWI